MFKHEVLLQPFQFPEVLVLHHLPHNYGASPGQPIWSRGVETSLSQPTCTSESAAEQQPAEGMLCSIIGQHPTHHQVRVKRERDDCVDTSGAFPHTGQSGGSSGNPPRMAMAISFTHSSFSRSATKL